MQVGAGESSEQLFKQLCLLWVSKNDIDPNRRDLIRIVVLVAWRAVLVLV